MAKKKIQRTGKKRVSERDKASASESSRRYGQRVIKTLGSSKRPALGKWKPGMAGTAPDGVRFVVYANHIRSGGDQRWRTNNPGSIKIGAFARANGAIGRDGAYAVFPDKLTGIRAFSALLRTPQYSQMMVRDVLQGHVAQVTTSSEARSHAMRYSLDSLQPLSSLDDASLSKLTASVTSSFATPLAAVLAKSAKNPPWAKSVLKTAQGQTTAPVQPIMFNPSTWTVGTWYLQQGDGTFAVSPNQNPSPSDLGYFARYDGNYHWEVEGVYAPGAGDERSPDPDTLPDAGNLPEEPAGWTITITVIRTDDTTYTMTLSTTGPDYPDGAYVAWENGVWLVLENTDGVPWNTDPGSDGENPAPGGQGDGGQNGGGSGGDGGGDGSGGGDGGGDPEPDPDTTGEPQ